MRRKYFKYIAIFTLGLGILGSCTSDFLEVEPKGTMLESNYYKNRTEAFNGLIAVYDAVGYMGGNLVNKWGATNSASDDFYAGGGHSTDVNAYQVWSNYTVDPATGPQEELWKRNYSGIFRANILLSKMPNVPMNEAEKNRFIAEAKALRAYFYFDLVRFFENVPLITTPVSPDEMYSVVQAAPEAVYSQIEQDLKDALTGGIPATVDVAVDGGRLTEGAVRALLGKVYLYQEKFGPAAEELAKVNGTPGETSQYGYRLVANYADLFQSSNKHNSESIFEVKFTNTSAAGWGCANCGEGNILAVMSGPRSYARTPGSDAPAYASGWSFYTVIPAFVNVFRDDPRYAATVLDMKGLVEAGKATYVAGYMDTGYFLKKFAALTSEIPSSGDPALNFPHDIYEIRLADTYLMEAEALVRGNGNADRALALLTAVRARVGLGAVPATLENIKRERRFELAGEGHRWFDLIRWGDAPQALAFKGFVAGKHEILPIPLLELDNTALEQNKEYGGTK